MQKYYETMPAENFDVGLNPQKVGSDSDRRGALATEQVSRICFFAEKRSKLCIACSEVCLFVLTVKKRSAVLLARSFPYNSFATVKGIKTGFRGIQTEIFLIHPEHRKIPQSLDTQDFAGFPVWQGQKDLNPRHAVLETAALPAELCPYIWWAIRDSNPGPTGYEPVALTN